MGIFQINFVLASLGGGLLGTAFGVIGAFILCGVLILIGIATMGLGNNGFLDLIALGPYFGPHISFAAAVAATAYAGRKGLLDGCEDILVPLYKFKRWDIYLVGAIFGLLGYFVQTLIAQINIPIDQVALTVVISNIIARLVFGESGLFGKTKNKGEALITPSKLFSDILIGFFMGLISSFATQITGVLVIGYAISAVTLIFLFYDSFPVTHHVSICAAYASAATGSILVGGIFGVLGILIGEIFGYLFNSSSDTYIDPPAVVIALLSLIVFIFL
jgi:hypothetical protein